jgi:MoxR-like ATPase
VTTPDLETVHEKSQEILDMVDRAVVGKRGPLTLVLSGILANGHVLLEDFPGLGKTLAARSLAQVLGLAFKRAQFTPDLLPGDLTGSFVYDQASSEFVFRPGPLFTGLLLADEINRTPPKTQAALLEAMQERQNPVEYEGTYPLPEAQLDRFLLRVSFGYPTADEEWGVLSRRMERQREEQTLPAVIDAAGLRAIQASIETVTVDDSIGHYCVSLASATRSHQHALLGASPRGSLALLLTARAFAVITGRDYVTPEDVKAVAHSALDHRISTRPELWMSGITSTSIVADVLRQVAAPSAYEPDVAVAEPGARP